MIRLSLTTRTPCPHASYIEHHLPLALALLDRPPADLSVVLVGDPEMSRLHDRYMADPTPTDVLTFELDHDDAGNVTEGEVVVCVPEAHRRSANPDDVGRELLLYALHGVLHLSGFDDTTADDHAIMHAAEDDLLTRIGVGPVFRPNLPDPNLPVPTPHDPTPPTPSATPCTP